MIGKSTISIFCILKKKALPADILNHNSTHEETIILLIIQTKKLWHYLAAKKTVCFLKRSNIKTSLGFLLFELSSLV